MHTLAARDSILLSLAFAIGVSRSLATEPDISLGADLRIVRCTSNTSVGPNIGCLETVTRS